VLLLTEGEDAAYITADANTAGVQTLLELVFYQIVQASETPEYVFGTAVASSKASVNEQQVPFGKKIERKRLQLEEPMQQIASLFLRMAATVGDIPDLDDYSVELEWPEVNPRDEVQVANTLKTLGDAFIAMIEAGIVGAETANEFLRNFIPSMLEWSNPEEDTDEQRRITEGLDFIQNALSSSATTPPGGAPGSALQQFLAAGRAPQPTTNGTAPAPPATNGTTAPPA
jgi:hypothetical protein